MIQRLSLNQVVLRNHTDDYGEARTRQYHPADASRSREQHTFHHQLQDQSRAASAQRRTNGNLALTSRAPFQQHARHIRAHDHEHEDHRAQEREDRVAKNSMDLRTPERSYGSAPPGVRLGVLRREARGDGVHDRLSLPEGNACIQARYHAQLAILVVGSVRRAEGQRSPHLRVGCRKLKVRGSDSYNPVQPAIEGKHLPKNPGIGPKVTSPVLMA